MGHAQAPPEQGSLRFLAERRVGKTTIITKMATEPAEGFDVLFLEVEGIDSCDHPTELLLNRFRPPVEIPPLENHDALQLAKRLLAAERIRFGGDAADIVQCMIDQTSNVPFYMERIASQLGLLSRPITVKDVEDVVLTQLTTDHDPWEMEHFRSRLETYYQRTVQDANNKTFSEDAIARTILDHFATVDAPQTIDEVWSIVRSQHALTDRNLIVQMLKSLGQDHYLISDTEKRYSFRFPLVKRWWKMAQGLQS